MTLSKDLLTRRIDHKLKAIFDILYIMLITISFLFHLFSSLKLITLRGKKRYKLQTPPVFLKVFHDNYFYIDFAIVRPGNKVADALMDMFLHDIDSFT